MQNKFVIGSLVRFNVRTDLVWKVVEVWDISYVASVTNKINKKNFYVITNVATNSAVVAGEDSMSPIEVKDLPESDAKEEESKDESK